MCTEACTAKNVDTSESKVKVDKMCTEACTAKNTDELMGYEGSVRDLYYTAFNAILTLQTRLQTCTRCPPDNPINAAISFGNSLMYAACLTEIYRTQLNPTISFLHEPGDRH